MAYLQRVVRGPLEVDAAVGMLQFQGKDAALMVVAEMLLEIALEATYQLAAAQLQPRFSVFLRLSSSCGSLARSVPSYGSSCRSP